MTRMTRSCRSAAAANAFTLVELLVVVGIIAVLVAMLLPALSRARQQAGLTKCAALLREISAATVMYCNENKGKFPPLRARSGDSFPFTNAGYIQNQDWADAKEVGSNVGRLVASRYLGNADPTPGSGAAPAAPYYECTSAVPDPGDKDRFKYMYNFHMKAITGTTDLYRAWPKLHGYGKESKSEGQLFSLSTGGPVTGAYPDVPRAVVTDPCIGLVANGLQYSTHNLRSSLAFNLGYPDGSVRTAIVKSSTPLPVSGDHKGIIGIIQYLEEVADGSARTQAYDYAIYGQIPMGSR